ncbi:MAG: hypothetical protein ACP5G2_00095 [Candidatus Bipolaricaulaceae bacterium]
MKRWVMALLVAAGIAGSGLAADPQWAVTFTLSGAPFLGVEVGWPVSDRAQARAGVALGVEVQAETTTWVLWGRTALMAHASSMGEPSPFIGGGVSVLLAPLGTGPSGRPPQAWETLELPLGMRWPLAAGPCVLGEIRLALPWLDPLFGREFSAFLLPLGITMGVAF